MEANKTTFDFHEIKTFSDACEKLGMKEHLIADILGEDREAYGQVQALYELLIIQKAINNGECCDGEGCGYYPYWALYPNEEMEDMEQMSEKRKQRNGLKQIFSCASADYTVYSGVRCASAPAPAPVRGTYTSTSGGFPLCFSSEEAAQYAAKQFEDLFFKFYGIKVKE